MGKQFSDEAKALYPVPISIPFGAPFILISQHQLIFLGAAF
jgi:hypothetical protein